MRWLGSRLKRWGGVRNFDGGVGGKCWWYSLRRNEAEERVVQLIIDTASLYVVMKDVYRVY